MAICVNTILCLVFIYYDCQVCIIYGVCAKVNTILFQHVVMLYLAGVFKQSFIPTFFIIKAKVPFK